MATASSKGAAVHGEAAAKGLGRRDASPALKALPGQRGCPETSSHVWQGSLSVPRSARGSSVTHGATCSHCSLLVVCNPS